MNNFGIKISQDNNNVNSSSGKDLVYSSKWSNLKIYKTIVGSVATGGDGTECTTSLTNPIDYPPVFMAYCEDPDNAGNWYEVRGQLVRNLGWIICKYSPTTKLFTLSVTPLVPGRNRTYNFKVILYIDRFVGSGGFPKHSDYGIRVAKENKTIDGSDTDMSLDSKYRNLTVNKTGVISASGGTVTLYHKLKYLPICMISIQEPYSLDYFDLLPAYYIYDPGAGDAGLAQYYINTNQLTVTYTPPASGNNVNFKYIIFNEKLA
jgi:hypothetical protein